MVNYKQHASDEVSGIANTKRLMKIEELSDFLKVPVSTIYKWTHQNYIPHYKIGNKLRFDFEEIIDWLETKHYNEKAI